jgi:DNA repair exonuclease SbcCD ATPase subunit
VQVVVDERTTERQGADWFSTIADNAIKAYLGNPRADRALVSRLATAWAVRGDIVKARDDRNDSAQQLDDLSQATEETRRNLRAIEKNRTAETLRQKLTARLAETAAKLDDLNRKLVELDSKLAEMGVRFSEGVREINVVVPATTAQ